MVFIFPVNLKVIKNNKTKANETANRLRQKITING